MFCRTRLQQISLVYIFLETSSIKYGNLLSLWSRVLLQFFAVFFLQHTVSCDFLEYIYLDFLRQFFLLDSYEIPSFRTLKVKTQSPIRFEYL